MRIGSERGRETGGGEEMIAREEVGNRVVEKRVMGR